MYRSLTFWQFALICLVVIHTTFCFAKKSVVKDSMSVSTPYGTFEMKNVSVMSDGAISGTIVNNTTRSWKYAQFHVYLKDKKGRFLTYRNTRVSCQLIAGTTNLAKGQIGRIEGEPAPSFLPIPGNFTDFAIEFSSDNSHFVYGYVFRLVAPRESPSASFGDDIISINFDPSNQQIVFQLQNRSANPIRLNWDQMAYVDLNSCDHLKPPDTAPKLYRCRQGRTTWPSG